MLLVFNDPANQYGFLKARLDETTSLICHFYLSAVAGKYFEGLKLEPFSSNNLLFVFAVVCFAFFTGVRLESGGSVV